MLKKSLLTLSLLLPLSAISATAYAGSTISDKSYWPNEARRSAQSAIAGTRGDAYDAFAYDRGPSHLQAAPAPSDVGSAWRYQGGPKSR